MRIEDAKKAYSAQLNTLWAQKQTLTKLMNDNELSIGGAQNFDRLEISRELSAVDAQYEATKNMMESIVTRENAIHNMETAKQQSEAAIEGAEEIGKIMMVYRRIASGDRVPPKDERRLMEFSHELYMAAKAAALMAQGEGEEHDSLWKDEKPVEGDTRSASEIAGDTEISVPPPEQVASAAVSE